MNNDSTFHYNHFPIRKRLAKYGDCAFCLGFFNYGKKLGTIFPHWPELLKNKFTLPSSRNLQEIGSPLINQYPNIENLSEKVSSIKSLSLPTRSLELNTPRCTSNILKSC